MSRAQHSLQRKAPAESSKPPIGGEVKLRPWQQEAFGVYRDAVLRGERAILLEATPGAGKTTAALVKALHQIKKQGASRIAIVVPTAHLKIQWARAALDMGLHLDNRFSNSRETLSAICTFANF